MNPYLKHMVGGALGGAVLGGMAGVQRHTDKRGKINWKGVGKWTVGGAGVGAGLGAASAHAEKTQYRRWGGEARGRWRRPPRPEPTVWDQVPSQVHNKLRGVAKHAKDKGNTPEARANARAIFEKMMGKHGIKGNPDEFIKHADAFRAGVIDSF